VNTGAPLVGLDEAEERVLHFQRKLHDWASVDAECGFHDLWNLVCDPATLLVAWSRVSRNRGSRTAGIDGTTRSYVERELGVERFLSVTRMTDRSLDAFVESRMRGNTHVRFGGRRRGNHQPQG